MTFLFGSLGECVQTGSKTRDHGSEAIITHSCLSAQENTPMYCLTFWQQTQSPSCMRCTLHRTAAHAPLERGLRGASWSANLLLCSLRRRRRWPSKSHHAICQLDLNQFETEGSKWNQSGIKVLPFRLNCYNSFYPSHINFVPPGVPPSAPKTKLAFIELMQTSMSVDPGMLAAFAMLDEDAYNPFALQGAFALFAI